MKHETTYDSEKAGLLPSELFRPVSLVHPDTARYLGSSKPYPDFLCLMLHWNECTNKFDTVNRYVSRYFSDNNLSCHRIK